ncbi:MAG: hypothetical protein FJ108_05480 [Deltaproteobacteria bacterium]|nr:hypothetical protein [Deltaproteobacteria bacterium]
MFHGRWLSLALCVTALHASGCGDDKTASSPVPNVVVAAVEQKSVEINSEWVGTTTGVVNAQIYPKVQGYLLK